MLEYTTERLEIIDAQVSMYEDVLVGEQSGRLLDVCMLTDVYNACVKRSAHTTTTPLSSQFDGNALLALIVSICVCLVIVMV
jgi:hypothetical protein